VFQLQPPNSNAGYTELMDGKSPAKVIWPRQIPTYVSGENPADSQFQLDNQVIGESGSWIWVALKGPKAAIGGIGSGVWEYRHWNRQVALNVTTGQYRIFSLSRSASETLYYPLWAIPPKFASSGHRVDIGTGDWVGVLPADPVLAASMHYHGALPAALAKSRKMRDLAVVTPNSWQSVDADAGFWNCYVMKDSNTHACPAGNAFPDTNALSQAPTSFNHGP
jgi:uncharacterized membrane protein